MKGLSEHDLLLALLAIAILLLAARGMAEVMRRLGQPEVLGELLGGFVLGPSALGALFPSVYHTLFLTGPVSMMLSGTSWLGAIFLLLIAGMEADLAILRAEIRPGSLAAALAMAASIVAGTAFAVMAVGSSIADGLFLGIVLSVTAVSVAAKIMMEREVLRREYAQVILAAGIASEVLVWILVSLVSSLQSGSPLNALRSAGFAVAFFAFAMTLGRRFTYWAMRRVSDWTHVANGQLSLVVVLTCLAAGLTQAMGLHALLGAFVFGVVLTRAPRINERLSDRLQAITLGFFAPIFFGLAGMRVDIFQLGSLGAVLAVLVLLLLATTVKVGFAAAGARLGGLRGWESVLVGFGLNLKGGTDVVVAIVGTELGLLGGRAYSMYAVVAILTVLISPTALDFLSRRVPPTQEEEERLGHEEAVRRSYVPHIERVLVPLVPQLFPTLAAAVVEQIATSKHGQGQTFDIVEVEVRSEARESARAQEARDRLVTAGNLQTVEVTQRQVNGEDALPRIIEASENYDLVAIGAHPPKPNGAVSLGRLQDELIDSLKADVLVTVDDQASAFDCARVQRILVATNGLEYSMAAGDIAASLAESCGAELVVLHVSPAGRPELDGGGGEDDPSSAEAVVGELAFRARRLGVDVSEQVRGGAHPGDEIVAELTADQYDLVVMGGVDRGKDNRLYLGRSIDTVLHRGKTPVVLLIAHR